VPAREGDRAGTSRRRGATGERPGDFPAFAERRVVDINARTRNHNSRYLDGAIPTK